MTEYFIYLLIALQIADVASTLYAFRSGAIEANPVMRKLMESLGTVPGLIVPKVIYGALIWYYQHLFPVEALVLVCTGYVAIVVNNIRVAKGK